MSAPYYADDAVTVHAGDCLAVLATLPDASVDAVVTDPPYGLGFMGREWDTVKAAHLPPSALPKDTPLARMTTGKGPAAVAFDGRAFGAWCELWTAECLRVLKPGGHLLAFGGTRTWHRLACAVEDAGFEVRDSIAWLYGSGFPKSLDVSKAIDKAAGAEREHNPTLPMRPKGEVGSISKNLRCALCGKARASGNPCVCPRLEDEPATDAAREWQGWGTALKPAFEPIVVARKPLVGTVAANVLAHGTGALNVDGCRVLGGERPHVVSNRRSGNEVYGDGLHGSMAVGPTTAGRWPANVVLDESQAEALDEQSGELTSGRLDRAGIKAENAIYGAAPAERSGIYEPDQGGASRFFYTAKADASERVRVDGIAHPTVKPLALMRWLVRLVTPPGGTILEPFAGSGTTVEACILEGFRCIAIEREADYLPLIVQRIHRRRDPVQAVRGAGDDGGLFDLLGEVPA